MTMLRPVSEMKDSGIECVGKIPKEWTMRKIKYGFTILSGATPKSDVLEFWDGDITWVTPADYKTNDVYVECGRKSLTQLGYDSCGTTIVPIGSLIFSKRAPIGTVAINKVPLCTNQGCLSCVPNDFVLSKYYYYVMSNFTELFEIYGSGTLFKEISAQSFANIILPYPDLNEQRAIASYLDDRCSKLDEIITEAEKSIEEYKELKQAVIANAVLCGLCEDVQLRKTGENWCKTIPSHWRFERGKYLFKETNIRSIDGSEELLTVSQYTGITPRSMKTVTMFEATSLVDYKICEVGDVAANTMWMWAGAVGVSDYYGVISPSYNTYRQIRGDFDSKYLDYLLRSVPLVSEYESLSTGIRASRLRLYPSQFLSIRYPVPPMNEQKEIVEYLNRKVGDMDALISEKQSLIEDLKAYKKSLIYEVVTGKRRVV